MLCTTHPCRRISRRGLLQGMWVYRKREEANKGNGKGTTNEVQRTKVRLNSKNNDKQTEQ